LDPIEARNIYVKTQSTDQTNAHSGYFFYRFWIISILIQILTDENTIHNKIKGVM